MRTIIENPFERYYVRLDGDRVVSTKFVPRLEFFEQEHSLRARIRNNQNIYTIFNLEDIIKAEKEKNGKDSYFQGLFGERILHVVLENLILETKKRAKEKKPKREIEGGVIYAEEKHIRNEFIATFNDRYLLKHKGKTNFIIIESTEDTDKRRYWYQQEKSGYCAKEIDGLAYMHLGRDMYLIVAESKTSTKWHVIEEDLEKTARCLLEPFNSLFPEHKLIYLFLAPNELLYTGEGFLREGTKRLIWSFDDQNIPVILVSMPEPKRSLKEWSKKATIYTGLADELFSRYNKLN
ncbi:hypothetical protein J4436_00335 [Candidatus Woesearchaeota archaeon]|nr:hypothetical protein [Candidatus Woesearchaeota archaeon]